MALVDSLGWNAPTPLISEDGTLREGAKGISEHRHRQLKGLFQGRTAVILTCGPSLETIDAHALRAGIRDAVIICVKQAYDIYGDVCRFHLFNEVRMKRYDYGNRDCIRICVSQFQAVNPAHVFYPIKSYRYPDALFVTNDYANWALHRSYVRPWGVGIMFELALHLPIYLGCSKVLIVGFDMNPSGKFHFYDSSEARDAKHYKVDDEEFGYARDSVAHYVDWARDRGVDVRLHSPLSALPIPPIAFEDIQGFVGTS